MTRGPASAAKSPRMTSTTSSSIRVKPACPNRERVAAWLCRLLIHAIPSAALLLNVIGLVGTIADGLVVALSTLFVRRLVSAGTEDGIDLTTVVMRQHEPVAGHL